MVNFCRGPDTLEGNAIQFVRIGQARTGIFDDDIFQRTGVVSRLVAAEEAGGAFT